MDKRAFPLLIVGLVLGAGIALPAPAHAGELMSRFANPHGGPTDACSQADPCDLVTAINDAAPGASVFVEPGTYGSATSPLTTELSNSDQPAGSALTIVGENATHPPVIITSAAEGLYVEDGAVSNLTIVSSSVNDGLDLLDSTADHVSVYATNGTYGACTIYNSSLTDSLCAQSGAGLPAMDIDASNVVDEHDVVRGVTLVATGVDSIGLLLNTVNTAVSMTATNSSFSGTGSDIRLTAATKRAVITLTHSAYRPGTSAVTGTAAITADGTDVTVAPKFIDPAHANFAAKASSPTVDVGATDPTAEVDLAGNPRTLGIAPDIGAYELLERPSVGAIKHVHAGTHKASCKVTVNGEGLRTQVSAVAKHGHHKTASKLITVKTKKAVKIRLKHLLPHTTYKVRVTAVNTAGRTYSTSRKVTTK